VNLLVGEGQGGLNPDPDADGRGPPPAYTQQMVTWCRAARRGGGWGEPYFWRKAGEHKTWFAYLGLSRGDGMKFTFGGGGQRRSWEAVSTSAAEKLAALKFEDWTFRGHLHPLAVLGMEAPDG